MGAFTSIALLAGVDAPDVVAAPTPATPDRSPAVLAELHREAAQEAAQDELASIRLRDGTRVQVLDARDTVIAGLPAMRIGAGLPAWIEGRRHVCVFEDAGWAVLGLWVAPHEEKPPATHPLVRGVCSTGTAQAASIWTRLYIDRVGERAWVLATDGDVYVQAWWTKAGTLDDIVAQLVGSPVDLPAAPRVLLARAGDSVTVEVRS